MYPNIKASCICSGELLMLKCLEVLVNGSLKHTLDFHLDVIVWPLTFKSKILNMKLILNKCLEL